MSDDDDVPLSVVLGPPSKRKEIALETRHSSNKDSDDDDTPIRSYSSTQLGKKMRLEKGNDEDDDDAPIPLRRPPSSVHTMQVHASFQADDDRMRDEFEPGALIPYDGPQEEHAQFAATMMSSSYTPEEQETLEQLEKELEHKKSERLRLSQELEKAMRRFEKAKHEENRAQEKLLLFRSKKKHLQHPDKTPQYSIESLQFLPEDYLSDRAAGEGEGSRGTGIDHTVLMLTRELKAELNGKDWYQDLIERGGIIKLEKNGLPNCLRFGLDNAKSKVAASINIMLNGSTGDISKWTLHLWIHPRYVNKKTPVHIQHKCEEISKRIASILKKLLLTGQDDLGSIIRDSEQNFEKQIRVRYEHEGDSDLEYITKPMKREEGYGVTSRDVKSMARLACEHVGFSSYFKRMVFEDDPKDKQIYYYTNDVIRFSPSYFQKLPARYVFGYFVYILCRYNARNDVKTLQVDKWINMAIVNGTRIEKSCFL